MSLDDRQQEIAETLFHAWQARRDHACVQRRLTRIADSLEGIAVAIRSEMEGGQARRVVRRQQGQKFDTTKDNQTMGPRDVHELPTADELAALTDQWRSACSELTNREREQEGL